MGCLKQFHAHFPHQTALVVPASLSLPADPDSSAGSGQTDQTLAVMLQKSEHKVNVDGGDGFQSTCYIGTNFESFLIVVQMIQQITGMEQVVKRVSFVFTNV